MNLFKRIKKPQQEPALQQAQKNFNILLVEDSRVDAAIVKALLTENGEFTVNRVTTLKEALTALSYKFYEAVLLDLNLPDSSGEESVKLLRSRYPGIPIIILSGQEEQVEYLRSPEFGVKGFLKKGEADSAAIRKNLVDAIYNRV